jgi:hypothetical protein
MRVPFTFLLVLIVGLLGIPNQNLHAQDDSGVSFQIFYDQLGDQGTWVQTEDYGYVFQPNVNDPEWAPYTDGHWVDTDAGWTWVSNESWGWATYHYGRWANLDGMGWVWIPGYRWAPAWVSWRYGGGYAGWAPLPPESFVGIESRDRDYRRRNNVAFGVDVDVRFHIGAGYYNFLRVEDLGESNYRRRYANRNTNYTLIHQTTNITNIQVNNNGDGRGGGRNFHGVNAGGPPLNEIKGRTRRPVQTVQLTQTQQAGGAGVRGQALQVYAPQVNATKSGQARPARVAQTLNHPTVNRGDSPAKPLQVTAQVKRSDSPAQAIQPVQTAPTRSRGEARGAAPRPPAETNLKPPQASLRRAEVVPAPPNPVPKNVPPPRQNPPPSVPRIQPPRSDLPRQVPPTRTEPRRPVEPKRSIPPQAQARIPRPASPQARTPARQSPPPQQAPQKSREKGDQKKP